MKDSSYPALLNKRARILASLNRTDLIVLGCNYLIMSNLKISGWKIICISLALLVITKFVTSRLEKGFFENLITKRIIKWNYKIGGLNE
jgi:hypothetical protein